jgi:ribosomal protein S18 acetylase RimI-like enzyme
MLIETISNDSDVRECASIAFTQHISARQELAFLPSRDIESYAGKLAWLAREGRLYAARAEPGGPVDAYLGWFALEEFRNIGRAALTPDWGLGTVGLPSQSFGRSPARAARELLRVALADMDVGGLRVHGIGVPSSRPELLEALSLTAYGRIVLDAAAPAAVLARRLSPARGSVGVSRATDADAAALARLDASLARHIGSSPVMMPGAHGTDEDGWVEWLHGPDARAFVARVAGEAIGFIKTDEPGFDVSEAVHGEETAAICGLYVDPVSRRAGVARALLAELVSDAVERGKMLVSVDCETHNPEALGFWMRWFSPVSWSFERRW